MTRLQQVTIFSNKTDNGYAIALDTAGNAYLTGAVSSTNFPVSAGAVQASCPGCSGGTAAFITKFYFGSGVPVVSLLPTSLNFGDEALKHTSAYKSVALKNTGTAPLHPSSFSILGSDPKDFGGVQNCRASVPPGVSCTVYVNFTPSVLGTRTADVSITDNAAGSPQSIFVSGIGVNPAPAAHFSPSPLNFGNVIVNVEVVSTITLTNTGTSTLSLSSASLSSPDPSDFGGNTTCTTQLTAGSSCTFTIAFKPTALGLRTATLTVADNASGSPQKVGIEGTGVPNAPVAKLSLTSLAFGSETVGHASASRSVTLTNAGGATMKIFGITITGSDPNDFSKTTTCGSTLSPGKSCLVSVTFKPAARGSRSAVLGFADNASGSPQKVSLSGTGT